VSSQKYLANYAEPEAALVSAFSQTGIKDDANVLVIPFYNETPETLLYWFTYCEKQTNTLLIAIVNRPEQQSDLTWYESLYKALPESTVQHEHLGIYPLKNESMLLWVDRCTTQPIPDNQGVGLARKIGNDIACQLIAMNRLAYQWIANTDADAILPDNYFQTLQQIAVKVGHGPAALVFPYEHIPVDSDPAIQHATQCYELSLQYYVSGLNYAGSGYAFHTLGSILAVNPSHYAQVRGFPKRAGAEDFYLLNKLAKTGEIKTLDGPTIQIRSRQSDRVPFGTGPAVKKILSLPSSGHYAIYHPASFDYLQAFLALIEQAIDLQIDDLQNLMSLPVIADITDRNTLDRNVLSSAVESSNIQEALSRALKQSKQPKQQQLHIDHWFDGFKTLKFIHWLRDHGLKEITIEQLICSPQPIEKFQCAALKKKLRSLQ